MRDVLFALLVLAGPAAAQEDVRPGPVEGRWALQRIGDAPFAARAELDLSEHGRIGGRGPCNGFSGHLTGDWPVMEIGPLRATRRACPELAQEHAFFKTLQSMRQGDVRDGVLILTDAAGLDMEFTRLPAPADE